MEKFVPYEKMNKKQKKAFNNTKRRTWTMNPVTRRPETPKAYDRKREKRNVAKEISA